MVNAIGEKGAEAIEEKQTWEEQFIDQTTETS